MKIDAADQAAMLETLGDPAVAPGGVLWVEFTDEQQVAYDNGTVETVLPFALASAEAVAALAIAAGQDGTVIAISAKEWRVLSIEPDGAGFVILQLGAP